MRIADVIVRDAAEIWASLKSVALGSTASKAAPGNHTHDMSALGALMKDANLSDLDSAATARTNLGLGTAATTDTTAYATQEQGAKADTAVQPTGTPVANQLAYWTTAQILAGANLVSCDATNSRIGIGTLAPLGALHVVGNGLTAHDLPGFVATDDSRAKTLGVQGDTFAYLVGYTSDKSFACGISTLGKAFAGSVTAHDFDLRRENVAKITLTAAGATLPAETASRVVCLDASKTLKSSTVTTTELESLTGIDGNVQDQMAAKAPLASPTFTGTPAAPTAAAGTNTTQIATTAFAMAALPTVSWYFTLDKTGTGASVATLTLTCKAATTMTITGGGKFYADSGGTTGETTTWNLASGSNTVYVKVIYGSSVCMVEQGLFVTSLNTWTSSTNAPSVRYDLSSLPAGNTYVNVGGSNTITGNLSSLPAGNTFYRVEGSNTITGNLSSLPAGNTYISAAGSNTITGNLSGLPAGNTHIDVAGSNTITGNLSSLPSGNTFFRVVGSNTITGNLSSLPAGNTHIVVAGNNTITYSETTGTKVWPATMRRVHIRPDLATSLTSTAIDCLLIDLSLVATWTIEKLINLKGTRTSASDAAVATLEGKGVTVTVTP